MLLQRTVAAHFDDDASDAVAGCEVDILIVFPGPIDAMMLDRRGMALRLELLDDPLTCSALARVVTRTASAVTTTTASSTPMTASESGLPNAPGYCVCPPIQRGPGSRCPQHRDRAHPTECPCADVLSAEIRRQHNRTVGALHHGIFRPLQASERGYLVDSQNRWPYQPELGQTGQGFRAGDGQHFRRYSARHRCSAACRCGQRCHSLVRGPYAAKP
jgi:hypothetical protein